MSQIWSKGKPVDRLIHEFTVGEDYLLDARLVAYDVRASKAHAKTLAKGGYLTDGECRKLCRALDRIAKSHAAGEWSILPEEEDCHTALERKLIGELGQLGERIHLGRSRNDQILVAMRLYMREAIQDVSLVAETVAETLDRLAERQGDCPIPGYTHMQRGMPSSVGLWAGAFASEVRASIESLFASSLLVESCPLGSAAGYGTPGLELDRSYTARLLGFVEPQEPVTACQLSRGKAEAALAFGLVLIQQDLGRLAAELCIYNTQEFGFVALPEEMTTGSSIMPQKRNPDVFELVRGTAAQAPSVLMSLLAVTAKSTSGYNRDLQLLKGPLMKSVDMTFALCQVMSHAVDGISFIEDRCRAAMSPELFAASQAFDLVKNEGLTFREAYRRVAAEYSSR